jgi:hypothetical protein
MAARAYVLISLSAVILAMGAVVRWQDADVHRAGAAALATPTAAHGAMTPVATATLTSTTPAAPSNLRLTGEADGLAWTDNSTDETGFLVTATDRVTGTAQTFPLPANTTSFQLPPGARANCAESRPSMSYAVVAVNASGVSEQADTAIRNACGEILTPTADTMIVSGTVPAAPRTPIVIEALDVATIRGIKCAGGQTVEANAAGPGYSRFSLTIERACVQRASGNLRVCWGEGQCQGFEFQPGQRLELGVIVLRTPVASPPDVGFGPNAQDGSGTGDDSVRTLAAAGFALVGVGALLFVGSLLAQARRRHGR